MLKNGVPLLHERWKTVDQLISGVMHYKELNAHSLQIPSHREPGHPPLSPSVHHGKHENCSLKLLPLCWAFSDSFQHHLKQEYAFPSLKKINLPWCQWLSGLHVFGLSHGIFTLIGDNVADLDHLLKDDILVRNSQTINNDLSTCIEMFYTSIQHFHKESQSSLHCSVFDFPELSTSG